MNLKRIEILGVPVDCVTIQEAVDAAEQIVEGRHPAGYILAVNPEKVMAAGSQPAVLAQLRSAALLIPDGVGIVIAARLFGLARLSRVPGAELMPRLCKMAARKGYPIFLYGARPDVVQEAARVLQRDIPGLRVAGTQHGYAPEEEMPALIERINASGAKLLFVAMGSPRQENWMARHFTKLTAVRVCQGVGGTFDVLSGRVARAPRAYQMLGLEWLYRFLKQPSRFPREINRFRFGFRVVGRWLATLLSRCRPANIR